MRQGRLAIRGMAARRWMRRALAGLGSVGLLAALGSGPARAADPVEVTRLVLADRELAAGGQQILQVSLRGTGSRPVRVGLRVELRDDKDARLGKAMDRVVQVAGSGEQREFFRFDAPNRFGRFTTRVELFTPDFKGKLLGGAPVFYAAFSVGSQPEPGMAAQSKGGEPAAKEAGKEPGKPGPPSFAAPKGLAFEKPDLVWENLDIQPPGLLVGEPLKIKADLRNVGGDIARNVDVKVDYFSVRTPGNLVSISKTTVQVLAPGDKVELEFETVFPEDSALGDYKVQLLIDPANKIPEGNKENNTLVSDAPVRLSLIKQIFPEAGYFFEQTGLFLFRWDSRRFDEFKVQVGTDPAFITKDSYFDIPQGDKWTKDKEVVPLEGELPDMAVGLAQRAHADQLYWRVLGRSSTLGVQSVSASLAFSIRRAAGKPEAANAGAGRPEDPGADSARPPARPGQPPGPPKDRIAPPGSAMPPAMPSEAHQPKEVK